MTQPVSLTDEEEAALDADPEFRQEVVDWIRDTAPERHIRIGNRVEALLDRYLDGSLSYIEVQREVMRPFAH